MATGKVIVEGSSVTASQMKDLWRQFADGSLTGTHLQAFLAHTNPFALPDPAKLWRTLKLGTHKDVDSLKNALKKAGFNISDWANDIMGKPAFTLAPQEVEVDLTIKSVADLGFKGNTRYDEICARAKELGLELCPPEVGPQLRLQYKDQPKGGWLVIAMEAIVGSDGVPRLFFVEHYGDRLWLYAYYGGPDDVWDAGDRFVFVSRK